MELSTYLRILRRNWIMVVAFTVLGLVAATAYTLSIKPTYTAQTKLFLATQSSGSVGDLQQGNTFIQARVQSYVEAAMTPAVLEPAAESLGKPVGELVGKVTASAGPNTVIISIVATDSSAVQAAAIAQAVGESLIEVIDELEKPTNGTGSSPVRLSVVTPASPPAEPSAPNNRLNIALGGAIGLALGTGLALLRNVLDTKVRGETDLQRVTDAPVLGGIAFDADATKKPLLTQAPSQGTRAESFRQIRTNLQFAHVSHGSKAVLVTSSLPGEGKSTTAINLAIAVAQGGQSVALVDADLRRSRVGEYLGLEKNAGLTTALLGKADLSELLQHWGQDELYVLTAGQTPHNPSELLGTEAMKNLILRLEQDFDAVIIDAPPLLPVTDAAVLAQHVGGVVLMVGSSRVKLPDLEKSLNALDMVDADVLGVVLNFLPVKGPDAYAYSYYSYETDQPKAKKGKKKPADRRKPRPSAFDSVEPPHDHAAR
ncbi:polysaccharide biosynthesis tyrosine autokinase [Pseudarthrobacter sp. C1]|uniref:polysaccharide biosynthesis tyrosine autokinase n=1 Tax=Pseudarthrobacter sp. C1 TaxID=3108940 RepID=UPI002B056AF1|nr:polysaccharide biosynthesis tyrosine autokinase [Pseudarthrobacter sp. C1]MEA3550249.1 polysaccharide biosynthesis tyrosine autokinase [Pseudarthrobacter sp. C1]